MQGKNASLINSLVAMFAAHHPVPAEVKHFLAKHCQIKTLNKGDYLLRAGEVCDQYYFIHKGIIRAFMEEAGKEITTWISVDGELVTSIYSMLHQRASVENIQVLKQATLLQLDAAMLERLFEAVPVFNTIIRKVITSYYQDAEFRAFIARIPSAEAKCKLYLQAYPHKAALVPRKYIASFLGIREETYSRIVGRRRSSSPSVS